MKKNTKTVFACQTCGYQTPKWMGKCPDCGQWDTFAEESQQPAASRGLPDMKVRPVPIDSIDLQLEDRIYTGIAEFDRVLGGGLVTGTLVLIGGDPGIGKSTLMLQALYGLAGKGHRVLYVSGEESVRRVLYVSGEESVRQIHIRSRRLNTISPGMLVVSEVDLEMIMSMISSEKPDVLVIDSIQTMFNSDLSSAPGSVSQVRESAMRLMLMAKKTNIPTFLVGHVTKEGAIAGPRLLEHMVDTVLYFEGDRSHVFRILRATKNESHQEPLRINQ